MKKTVSLSLAALMAALLLAGCAATGVAPDAGQAASYRQASQEEAKELMEKEEGYILLDVRTREEFDQGHIPGAICLPNETIGAERPGALPDLAQLILIYCRSGNRSKQASQKLANLGYTNVVEFGGINTWTGDVVTE